MFDISYHRGMNTRLIRSGRYFSSLSASAKRRRDTSPAVRAQPHCARHDSFRLRSRRARHHSEHCPHDRFMLHIRDRYEKSGLTSSVLPYFPQAEAAGL